MKKSIFLLSIFTPLVFSSCNNTMEGNNTHTSGDITMYIEESFKPLFDTSIYTYEGQFPHATIEPRYVTETQAIDAFVSGKTSTICITREFTEQEKRNLRKSQIEIRSDKLARDAVAMIVNVQNSDTLMTVDRVKRILSGQDTLWNGLKTGINVVFDNENSANFIYMKELAKLSKIPANIFAVKSNEEVINYVKANKNALGVIGVNWISDEDDPQALAFRDGINVVAIAEKEGKDYFKPYQAYIYTKEYPLTREVWLLNKAGRTSLNTGFVLFMIGEKGQLIIQKSSLIPANMVARFVQIKSE